MDKLTPKLRSELMARVGGKNTKPELVVRSLLHALGYRFRLHRKDLPGKPDIVLPKWRTAVFVHGCFWHGHDCRRGARPTSNVEFWQRKIDGNQRRDQAAAEALTAAGWRVLVVWECELKAEEALIQKLRGIAEP